MRIEKRAGGRGCIEGIAAEYIPTYLYKVCMHEPWRRLNTLGWLGEYVKGVSSQIPRYLSLRTAFPFSDVQVTAQLLG